jgi:hypothetical protein
VNTAFGLIVLVSVLKEISKFDLINRSSVLLFFWALNLRLIFQNKTNTFRELALLPSSDENHILVVPIEGTNPSLWAQRNKGHNPPSQCVLGSCPDEHGSVARTTRDRRTALKLKLFVLDSRLQRRRPQSRKTILGSSLGKYCGFRDNTFFPFYSNIRIK